MERSCTYEGWVEMPAAIRIWTIPDGPFYKIIVRLGSKWPLPCIIVVRMKLRCWEIGDIGMPYQGIRSGARAQVKEEQLRWDEIELMCCYGINDIERSVTKMDGWMANSRTRRISGDWHRFFSSPATSLTMHEAHKQPTPTPLWN